MKGKNKILIKINGQEYPIVGSEPKEYLLKVGSYVDDQMEEIARGNKRLSTAMIAVLTSINIADQYLKLKDQMNGLQTQVNAPLNELEKAKEDLDAANRVLEDKDAEIFKLEERLKYLMAFKDNHQNEVISLRESLNEKEVNLNKAEEIINDLQNKLFENQIKLVEARKQIEDYLENTKKF
ncbi:cell division protein ZapA [Alkaliphilus serpentinus]|uniref:Cell division protein ZapA n=1 Tax=Alkaliphilus serpentinus TaxID=1482731 RepID=A0A833HNK8_9FIRM|nr:cell division protein ZapA [Alkaliphilus serpentinus]KAB3529808.1 cell division protein ZapA [Alkaliphilus serpentinus]